MYALARLIRLIGFLAYTALIIEIGVAVFEAAHHQPLTGLMTPVAYTLLVIIGVHLLLGFIRWIYDALWW